jgi:hypothetical protein
MPKFKVGDLVSWWEVTVISNIHGYDSTMCFSNKRSAKFYANSMAKEFHLGRLSIPIKTDMTQHSGFIQVFVNYSPEWEKLATILCFTKREEHYRVPQCYLTLVNRDAT